MHIHYKKVMQKTGSNRKIVTNILYHRKILSTTDLIWDFGSSHYIVLLAQNIIKIIKKEALSKSNSFHSLKIKDLAKKSFKNLFWKYQLLSFFTDQNTRWEFPPTRKQWPLLVDIVNVLKIKTPKNYESKHLAILVIKSC